MEELLIIIGQFLIELLLNITIDIPLDWGSSYRTTPEAEEARLGCTGWAITGAALGLLSLLIWPHTWIRWSSLRMASLALSPILSGFLSQAITRRRTNPNLRPRNHFWYAFWFTLGWVLIRFLYASHD